MRKGVFKMTTNIRMVTDHADAFFRGVKLLEKEHVLVGIPAEKAPRNSEEAKGHDISNAALAYIHNFGSPTQNIPPRPFMDPGIMNAKDQITAQMQKAGEAALDGNADGVRKNFEAVGLIAATSVKLKIREGPFQPLRPATIRARQRRAGKKLASSEIRPLIDTGQLLASMTYVVREKR